MNITQSFVCLQCTPKYIYNIQYVIDKCYHSCLISKILNITVHNRIISSVLYI
nr:MAG TPA: hypothetical protein [Caudoviricetes sp.]